ncbi:MAG: hypothetical protein R3C32_03555 [Chloroflexota bacterium]
MDRAAEPGAKCSYVGGAAGTIYLTGIKLLHGPEVRGIHGGLRSVGYKPIIQHRQGGAWVTVRRGRLSPARRPRTIGPPCRASAPPVPVTESPNRFRLLVRSTGSRAMRRSMPHADAGHRRIRPDHPVPASVRLSCDGAVSNVS